MVPIQDTLDREIWTGEIESYEVKGVILNRRSAITR